MFLITFGYFFGDFLFQRFFVYFAGIAHCRELRNDFKAFGQLVHGQLFAL